MYNFLRILMILYLKVYYGLKIEGRENIPKSGRAIIYANHTHAFDPLLVAASTKRKIAFLAKKELFSHKYAAFFFKWMKAIPVNRDGNDAYSLIASMRILKEDGLLGIFPEGTRQEARRTMGAFKPGVSMLAVKCEAVLVPAYITGDYKYRGKLRIRFGAPYTLDRYYGGKNADIDFTAVANGEVREKLMALKDALA